VIAVDEARWPIVTVAKRGRFTVAGAIAHIAVLAVVLAADGFLWLTGGVLAGVAIVDDLRAAFAM